MAELNEKKLVNAAALRDVAKGVYAQVQADIDAVEAQIEDANLFETDMVTVEKLGGIAAGSNLNGMTVQEVLSKLLYPHVKPTVGSVSPDPKATVREHGNYVKVTQVTASVTKKSNQIVKVELYKGSTLLGTKEDMPNGGTAAFAGLSEDTANGTKFTVKAYALNEAGTGNDVVSADSSSFTYVYPFYQGVMAAGAEINEGMVKGLNKVVETKGNKNYNFTTAKNHAVFAYPKSYGTLVQIYDPSTFPNIDSFTRYEVDIVCGDGKTQTYYVYVSGATTNDAFNYRFCFTDIK